MTSLTYCLITEGNVLNFKTLSQLDFLKSAYCVIYLCHKFNCVRQIMLIEEKLPISDVLRTSVNKITINIANGQDFSNFVIGKCV